MQQRDYFSRHHLFNLTGLKIDLNIINLTHEMYVQSNGSDTVSIEILSSLTDLLTVDENEDSTEYYYGLKLCLEDTGYENTLIINDGDIGDINTITVYPKKVEGIIT